MTPSTYTVYSMLHNRPLMSLQYMHISQRWAKKLYYLPKMWQFSDLRFAGKILFWLFADLCTKIIFCVADLKLSQIHNFPPNK